VPIQSSFPGEKHDLAFAGLFFRPAPQQQFEFFSLAAVVATSPVSGVAAAKRQEPFHHRSALSIYLLMALLDLALEMPLPSVLDDTDTDQLLVRLRLVHSEPRFDIAPELIAARRRARLPVSDI
jgi:hypothetical protein